MALPEQRQNALRCLIGDGKRLHAQLLLDLQSLKPGRGFFHVGIDQRPDPGLERVNQGADKLVLDINPLLRGTKVRRRLDCVLGQPLDRAQRSRGTLVGCHIEFTQHGQPAACGAAG